MIILGIDPGTARMGYSVIEVKTPKKKNATPTAVVIKTGVLVTPSDMEMHKRLRVIYKGIHQVLKENSPTVMVIERLFFNTNVKTALTVGQARGIAMLAAADKDLLLFEYTALEAKKWLTGYGRASKQEMQEAVRNALNLDTIIKSDDANDALAISLCFLKKDFGSVTSIK